MQNRTMRAVVSTQQAAAAPDFCMTWRTFMEDLSRRSAAVWVHNLQATLRRVYCLRIETTRRNGAGPAAGNAFRQLTFPATIGWKAISGSSAVPVPSVLFKLGAAYRLGKLGTTVPSLNVKPLRASPCSAM